MRNFQPLTRKIWWHINNIGYFLHTSHIKSNKCNNFACRMPQRKLSTNTVWRATLICIWRRCSPAKHLIDPHFTSSFSSKTDLSYIYYRSVLALTCMLYFMGVNKLWKLHLHTFSLGNGWFSTTWHSPMADIKTQLRCSEVFRYFCKIQVVEWLSITTSLNKSMWIVKFVKSFSEKTLLIKLSRLKFLGNSIGCPSKALTSFHLVVYAS